MGCELARRYGALVSTARLAADTVRKIDPHLAARLTDQANGRSE